jgi:hypothetical protein
VFDIQVLVFGEKRRKHAEPVGAKMKRSDE